MPKHPVSLWLIAERKRHGWKAEEVARRLREAGVDAADGTYRVWESGRKPKDDAIRAMETLFGSSAPKEQPQTPDLAALVAALTEQTRQQVQLVALLTEQNAMLKRLLARSEAGAGETVPSGEGGGPLPRLGLARGVRTLAAMESAEAPEADPSSGPGSAAAPREAR